LTEEEIQKRKLPELMPVDWDNIYILIMEYFSNLNLFDLVEKVKSYVVDKN